jgi:hypothetical protein
VKRALIRIDFDRVDDLAHWLACASRHVLVYAPQVMAGGFVGMDTAPTTHGTPAQGVLRVETLPPPPPPTIEPLG